MADVSVVIPSLNEVETIGLCIAKVKKVFADCNIDGEIIIADNSTDGTAAVALSLGARVVTPDRMGYGYAYSYGFSHAIGKYFIMGDADNTYDFTAIPGLLEPLLAGEADFVIGSRFKGEIKKGAMPWLHQYVGNPAITRLFNMIVGAGLSDACSGMFALPRQTWDRLDVVAESWDFNLEMISSVLRNKLRIREVPITYYPREKGAPKLTSFQGGWRNFKFLAAHLLSRR